MLDVLVRAGCFVAIILLGYFLKKIGVFRQEDFSVVSKITIRITLPAAIVTSFAGKQIDASLLTLSLLGLGGGLIYVALGFGLHLHRSREERAFAMLNLTGYNIGTFVLPFAQSFLGSMGVVATSLFDVGNSVMCLGGAYSLASMVHDGSPFSLRRVGRTLVRSVPFMCYITMLALNLLRVRLPGPVPSFAEIIGNANAFMAMFMIGVGFRLGGDRSQLGTIVKLLTIRYGVGTALALAFYFLLPFSLEIRQALVILALSPIGSAVPGFTGEMGGDEGLSSALNSISILISIVVTVTLLSVML